jgi:uroporphyrinogen decarboxylase
MDSLEKLRQKIKGGLVQDFLFCPAIYEHKARLIDKSVSEVSQNSELLAESVFAEYETYDPDMLTVGIDIYNVEAEAIGCEIEYPQKHNSVPSIKRHLIKSVSECEKLPAVDPEKDGRMRLFVEAGDNVNKKLGKQIPVRGAVSGPYSIAVGLIGIETLLMDMITKRDDFEKLLDYCTGITIRFGLEFIKRGVSVCVFDSQASPPLISPGIYKDSILPRMKRMNKEYKSSGCEFTEYVVGGKTNDIADMITATGFDIVLNDFTAEFENMNKHCQDGQLIRKNINPQLIEQPENDDLDNEIKKVVNLAGSNNNVLIGTGVLSYDTNPENIIYTKNKCEAIFRKD